MKTKPKILKTTIHYYYYNISDEKDQQEYCQLVEKLEKTNGELFDSISSDSWNHYRNIIKPLDNTIVDLETKCLFSNQWNTTPCKTSKNGLRVFDWAETIVQNRSIKIGQWLEITKEMQQIRKDVFVCGYCGKNYFLPDFTWCSSCIGSEHLTKDYLPLLKLLPVCTDRHNLVVSAVVPDGMFEDFQVQQEKNRKLRLENQIKRKIESLNKDIKDAEIEKIGFMHIIQQGLNFDNVIYYNHTGKFVIGWRKLLSEKEKQSWIIALKDFPYPWEFKKE